jgi:oxalate decarboxylase/phosphoglucose isomerase-like protein (cupin superfamily)
MSDLPESFGHKSLAPGAIDAAAGKVTAHAESFRSAFTDVNNEIFKVIFFPDRIYHERFLNATRSPRYRYNVTEVRSYLDITAMKAEVFLDGRFVSNVFRIEYGATRLVEQARERRRFLRDAVIAWIQPLSGEKLPPQARVQMAFDEWIGAFQVEIWETLEPPDGVTHDFSVLDQMGLNGAITAVPQFASFMRSLPDVTRIQIAFRERERSSPFGYAISDADAGWDNAFLRSHQEPVTQEPSSRQNTIEDLSYLLDFQRGYFRHLDDIKPVYYRNAMMDGLDTNGKQVNPDARDDNIIAMRWIIQREFGGSMIFFHHVTIPPGCVEGNHQHVGSEELYFIVEGDGIAYIRDGDDPATVDFPLEERMTMGLGPRMFRRLPVRPGSVVYTKSGGMHGIQNTGAVDLKFVAFLYHST